MNRNILIYLAIFIVAIYAGGAYEDHNRTVRYESCIAHHKPSECKP